MLKRFLKEWKKKEPRQKIYMGLGGLLLLLAVIGVFLPLIPQVPFAIASAFFFSKGSRRIHEWIRENRYFGKPVKDWEDHQIVRTKLKIFSTLAMLGGAAFGHWKMNLWWALAVDLLFAIAITFVVTRKSEANLRPRRKKAKIAHPRKRALHHA
jgi:uncharacterized membrane protein YbaN (DUF454 family)